MADRRGLEIVGVAFGLVTAIVVMIGGMVVKSHMNGQLSLDAGSQIVRPLASMPVATVVR
jgi:hypothetical protein